MSVNTKLTAIADEIRELSGTSGAMGLDAMATHVGEANDEVGNQTELLAQVFAALDGKAAGGGGSGGGGSVETCTVTIKSQNGYTIRRYFANLYTNGVTHTCGDALSSELKLENVVCGSTIYFVTGSMIVPSYSVSGGAAHVYHENMTKCDWGFSAPTTVNASATITVWDDD